MEKIFGLIGQTLSHSFSKTYFDEKFFREGLKDCRYELFPLVKVEEVDKLVKDTKGLRGLNVTLPYKETVMRFLDTIDPSAQMIGAVNVIKVNGGKRYGYNTDADAFRESLSEWLAGAGDLKALIFGSGGSSKAVRHALNEMKIPFLTVSRDPAHGNKTYEELRQDKHLMAEHTLLINCTPLGMTPHTEALPPIDVDQLTPRHYVYDLIYNPARTLLLQKAEMHGAKIKNGLQMLHLQAEKSWAIWNN